MNDEKNSPLRPILIKALAVLVAFIVFYAGAWIFLSYQLNAGIDAWIEQQKKAGLLIRHSGMSRGGFPFSVNVNLDQPVIASDRKPRPFVWQGQQAIISMKPWKLRNIRIDLSGSQEIEIVNSPQKIKWRGHAKVLSADMHFVSSAQVEITLMLKQIDMKSNAKHANAVSSEMQLERGRVHVMQNKIALPTEKTPSLSLSVDLANLKIPKQLRMILGHYFSKLAFNASVLGPLPKQIKSRPLLAWRDAGGTIEIERIDLKHGPLEFQSNGTLALDRNLQPVGAFTAKIYGFFDVITALQKRGLIKSNIALTAQLILGVMAKRHKSEDRSRLDISVSIQNQKIYAGPLAIAKMPFIRWDKKQNLP